MRPFRPASLSVADPAALRILLTPAEPAGSELDQLRRENAILRRQLGAVIDLAVHQEMTPHRNKAEHPFTPVELADIEAFYRRMWANVCLTAAKEQ